MLKMSRRECELERVCLGNLWVRVVEILPLVHLAISLLLEGPTKKFCPQGLEKLTHHENGTGHTSDIHTSAPSPPTLEEL